jgi:mannose-6-phosphate isomerase-like protein (cupin superfamily)
MDLFRPLHDAARFSPDKMRKVNVFDTPRMFCDLYCFEPGQAQTPHRHAGADKVYVVLSGSGHFRIGAEERHAGPGVAVLAPADAEHGVSNPGPQRLEVLVFMAPKPGAS